MRRLWCGVFLLAVLANVAGAGAPSVSRAAESGGTMSLSPNPVDPGAVLQASGSPAPVETCAPDATVSIVVFSGADPVSGASSSSKLELDRSWKTSGWRLPPDLSPGGYSVRARCEGVPADYEWTATLSVRLQEPGDPDVNPRSAAPGAVIQVGSGGGLCIPPAGSKPVVRVRFFDAAGVQRAAAENFVFNDGRWIAEMRLPEITPQDGAVTASCHAFSSTFAAYAVYGRSRVVVQSTAVPTTAPASTEPTSGTGPDGSSGTTSPPAVVTPPIVPVPGVDVQSLPATPLAASIIAEPTYTG